MRNRLLVTVASAALIAGATFASAQTGGGGGGTGTGAAGGGAGGSSTMERGSGGTGASGATERGSAPAGGSAQQQGTTAPRSGQAEQRQAPAERQGAGQQERQGAGQQDRQGAGQGGRAQESTGAAPSNVSVSSEQRTQIRQRLGSNTSARIDRSSVNFSLSVGVAVPRTVRVHDLPAEIVTIVPAYRGYKYVIVEDEIVIIDPQSWKIVYIIES